MITGILFILSLPTLITLVMVGVSFIVKMSDAEKRWWRLQMLTAYDQLVNTYFKGWADESISSRAYRRSLKDCKQCGMMQKIINTIFFWEPDHCKRSYESEMVRSQLPPSMRGDD
jgi:hypothetical protein